MTSPEGASQRKVKGGEEGEQEVKVKATVRRVLSRMMEVYAHQRYKDQRAGIDYNTHVEAYWSEDEADAVREFLLSEFGSE